MRQSVRLALAATALATVGLSASTASADDTVCQLEELGRTASVADHDGVVRIDFEQVLFNPCEASIQRDVLQPIPTAATVDRFTVERRSAAGDVTVLRSAITDREGALEAHRTIGDRASTRPDPIALEWAYGDVEIRNLDLEPGETVALRYGISAPCTWTEGACTVALLQRRIAEDTEDTDAREPIDVIGAESTRIHHSVVDETRSDEFVAIRVARAETPTIDAPIAARYGAFQIDAETTLAAVEIDLAGTLSEIPSAPTWIFVVDLSRSMGQAGIDAQLQLIADVLAHTGDARVDLVLFDRRARRLVGEFVDRETLAAEIALARRQGRLALAHGSMLDDALALAVDALAGQPTPRLMVTTDGLLRYAWDTDTVLQGLDALADDAVVHVVEPGAGPTAALHRNDDDPLAPLALAHHGIAASFDLADGDDDARIAAAEGLVRPTRIDQIEVEWDVDRFDDGPRVELPAMSEGAGFSELDVSYSQADDPLALPDEIVVRGKRWAETIEVRVRPDAAFSAAIAGRALVDHTLRESEEVETALALQLGIVTQHTSFVVVDPNHRALTYEMEHTGYGMSSSCWSSCGGSRCGLRSARPRIRPDHHTLADAYTACTELHGAAEVWIEIETTLDEVVDVTVGAPTDPLATCLEEAAWQIEVPETETAHDHSQWTERWDGPRLEHYHVREAAREAAEAEARIQKAEAEARAREAGVAPEAEADAQAPAQIL